MWLFGGGGHGGVAGQAFRGFGLSAHPYEDAAIPEPSYSPLSRLLFTVLRWTSCCVSSQSPKPWCVPPDPAARPQTLLRAVAVAASCSARKAKVDELRQKLEKLLQSATLVEQRVLYDRAVFWAAVKVQQDKLGVIKQVLEVRAAWSCLSAMATVSWGCCVVMAGSVGVFCPCAGLCPCRVLCVCS